MSIFHSAVPPTPAEAAVASATWERRGILGRLVRLDNGPKRAEERRPAAHPSLAAGAPAARSL